MSLWRNRDHGMYDCVYYRIDDNYSVEISGIGQMKLYWTNPNTHRITSREHIYVKRFPLYCYERIGQSYFI